jgi:flavin-dependent dehydrogenase
MIVSNQRFQKKFDIMIVGGGPAGLSTWLHLKKFNPDLADRTILIEKKIYPRDKLCGGALGEYTDLILKQLKINIDIPSVPIHNIECLYKKEIFKQKKHNFFRIIRRMEFDHALAKIAIDRGLKLYENEQFLDFSRHGEYVNVKTNKTSYKLKIIIGTDGSLSTVRKKMNLSEKSHLATAIEVFNTINPNEINEFSNKTAVFDFSFINEGVQGYAWHFPCISNNLPSLNHGIGDFRIFPDRKKPDLKNIFKKILKDRNILQDIKSWSGAPIRLLSKDNTIAQRNIILAGDAAGIDPALGGGIQLALLYGELAALTSIEAVENNNFSFNDYREKLYEHKLGKYISHMTEIAYQIYSGDKTMEGIYKLFG